MRVDDDDDIIVIVWQEKNRKKQKNKKKIKSLTFVFRLLFYVSGERFWILLRRSYWRFNSFRRFGPELL